MSHESMRSGDVTVPVETMRPVLEGLLARLAPELSGGDLGEVLEKLLWLTDDNGSDVIYVLREWLDSGNRRKVEAALSVSEAFLYENREILVQKFDEVRQ